MQETHPFDPNAAPSTQTCEICPACATFPRAFPVRVHPFASAFGQDEPEERKQRGGIDSPASDQRSHTLLDALMSANTAICGRAGDVISRTLSLALSVDGHYRRPAEAHILSPPPPLSIGSQPEATE